ncbi:MAG: DUF1080 domain-containing protein [Candidatus Hydrogenedentes bacterium]|nr:DUF1080 domain-containing protein [Candidatus Hydrogenedentota bacterium]
MKRIFPVLAVLMMMTSITIAAEDDDMIMGNYHGAFTNTNGANRYIRAQVIAQSKTVHRIVVFIGENEASATRLAFPGKVVEGVALFKKAITLPALGGKFNFEAHIENETMTGTLHPQEKRRSKGEPFELKRVFIEPPTRGMVPAEEAVVIFDGTNISNWERYPLHWCLNGENAMKVCGCNFKTIDEYGSGLYHIEFQTPFMPTERGQGRGNSGVYLLGRYEVQVLDTFGVEPADNFCGGIYSFATPIADAILPPLQWQTYDITFTAPTFDDAGAKVSNAHIHVLHNGILIHDNVELDSGTPGGVSDQEATKGPLLLQDHGNQVQYRNIWFKPAE